MKRIFFIVVSLLATCFAYANFVEKRFDGEQVTIEEAVSHFNEWFGTGDSEFVLFFDETDDIGMRDMDYQQYHDGIKVENCALYVHSRNGYVTLINGDVMPIQSKPESELKVSPRDARKKARVSEDKKAERTFIHETNSDGDIFYDVYKITTDTTIIYIDVTTGEIKRSLPLIHGATTCRVTTKYSGTQSISCETVDGEYRLRNNDKNIRTCYANMGNYNAYPSSSYGYTNSTTNWDNYYLTSVTIDAVHNAWWDVLGEDSYPDIYIRIKDASGNYLFTSDYKQDCGQDNRTSFPITFYISKLIKVPEGAGLTIEVYDEDLISDTQGANVTLNSNALSTYKWGTSSSNTQGSFEITKSHPAFDIHWGLEKAYDFYKNMFGLEGFNGQSTLLRAYLHNSGGPDNIKPEMDYAGWISIFGTRTGYYNNAYASGDPSEPSTAHLFFGIGNEIGNSEVGLNTIVHEFTHLVTRYRPKGDLVYSGESGAINEGYSDAMPISNDVYMYGTTDWLYDKESNMKINGVQYSYIRNLKNPKAGGPEGPKPDTYGGQNWVDPTNTSKENDYGGVHMNNSIFTHWYYILCEGKTGVNDNKHSYSVSPIGMTKALSIIWRMHRTYLPPQATFIQARQYAIQSAKDLYPGDENVLKSITDAWYAVGVGSKYVAPQNTITVKAKVPANWSNSISAWTWSESNAGTWATLALDGDWVTYTSSVSPLNIIFVNGSGWSTDANQTVNITLTESSCIEITNNGTSKCKYTVVDCNPSDFQLKPGKYVIVANRVEDDKNNWFYMTADLGTASTKRFQAISADSESIDAIATTGLDDKYIWELEADGSNWKLKNGGQYITWKSGNSANLDATGKSLTFDVVDNQVVAHFYDGSAERYLSLHVGNDYFAFYANTGQIEQLYFLPCEEGQQPPVEDPADEFIVLAQRNENSNWFYMTADLGTAGTKRFQAIDAGTPNKALINTSPTDTKYIWSFEEVDGGVALVNGEQYASWKSGNSAILSTTPMALNIIDVSEDQVNMSFVDGEGYTRYLSLNATAGNNYFAFYKGTTQKCNLLIIPYGEKITTDIDVILHETPIIRKVIRDGQLLIIRDGKIYTVMGQELR